LKSMASRTAPNSPLSAPRLSAGTPTNRLNFDFVSVASAPLPSLRVTVWKVPSSGNESCRHRPNHDGSVTNFAIASGRMIVVLSRDFAALRLWQGGPGRKGWDDWDEVAMDWDVPMG